MNKLSIEKQLEVLKAVKEKNKDKMCGDSTDSFFLCVEIGYVLGIKSVAEDIGKLIPLFKIENAYVFSKYCSEFNYGKVEDVWFINDVERHAFLDWMIETLEGGQDEI